MPNPLKLVELDNEYLDLVEQLQEAEGVLSADLERRLDEITAMQVQKADTYIMAMKNFEAISIKVDEMKQRFMRQLNAIKREQERWKDAMLLHLEQTRQDFVIGEFGRVRKMFSQKVDDDVRPEDIDQKYLRYSIVISGVSLEMVEKLFIGFDHRVSVDIDKQQILADLRAELNVMPKPIQEKVKQGMAKGEPFAPENIPGARMTVTKFVRVF